MILLDTDVLSAVMREVPEPRAFAWINRQPPQGLFLSSITIEEILFGIRLLPTGRRRRRLEKSYSKMHELFSGRILSFDEAAASETAAFRTRRRAMGRPMEIPDAQIAGIAKSRALSLATFNTKDFAGIDLQVIDPHGTDEGRSIESRG